MKMSEWLPTLSRMNLKVVAALPLCRKDGTSTYKCRLMIIRPPAPYTSLNLKWKFNEIFN